MRRTLPESGVVFLKLQRPEDRALYSIAATLMQEDTGEDVSCNTFLVQLMRHYVSTRNPVLGLNSKPTM
jgi:hypothetical protein